MHTSNCLGFARVVGLQFYFVLICTFLSSFLHWAIHNTPTHNLSHFDKSWKFISFKGATWVGVLFFNRKLGSDWFNYSPDIFHWGLILVIYIYIYICVCIYVYIYSNILNQIKGQNYNWALIVYIEYSFGYIPYI